MKQTDPPSAYTLGSSPDEQARLIQQRDLYGDTRDIQFDSNARICELGCGPGSNLWLAAASPQGSYYGVDNEKDQIRAAEQRARQLGLTNARFGMGDAAHTGLSGDSFDAVFVRCVLVHSRDPVSIAKEALRLIRKGGQAVFIEPDDTSIRLSPNKSNLLRCWYAKNQYMTNVFRTDPSYVREEFHLLHLLCKATIAPHAVRYDHTQPELCRRLMSNWLQMIDRISASLISGQYIDADELAQARIEAETVDEHTFASLTLWRAFAQK